MKFIQFTLRGLLRHKFHETKLLHHIEVEVEYFYDFAFLNIEGLYSTAGKVATDECISIILAAIKELERH